jgi:MFS family permease
VAPALPLITQAYLDAPEYLVSLIGTLPALAIALTGFFVGALWDRIGKIRILVASIIVFTIAGSSGSTSLPYTRSWRAGSSSGSASPGSPAPRPP